MSPRGAGMIVAVLLLPRGPRHQILVRHHLEVDEPGFDGGDPHEEDDGQHAESARERSVPVGHRLGPGPPGSGLAARDGRRGTASPARRGSAGVIAAPRRPAPAGSRGVRRASTDGSGAAAAVARSRMSVRAWSGRTMWSGRRDARASMRVGDDSTPTSSRSWPLTSRSSATARCIASMSAPSRITLNRCHSENSTTATRPTPMPDRSPQLTLTRPVDLAHDRVVAHVHLDRVLEIDVRHGPPHSRSAARSLALRARGFRPLPSRPPSAAASSARAAAPHFDRPRASVCLTMRSSSE